MNAVLIFSDFENNNIKILKITVFILIWIIYKKVLMLRLNAFVSNL